MTPIVIITGLISLLVGIAEIFNPKLRGPRDFKLISGEVGSGERVGAYAVGACLIVIGLGFLYLGL